MSRRVHKNCKSWLTVRIGEKKDFYFSPDCAVLFEFFTAYIIELRYNFPNSRLPVKKGNI